jgi:malate synthase
MGVLRVRLCRDFAVFLVTCHEELKALSAQPTLYLPKMEGRFETEWWSKIFKTASGMLGIDPKVIRSTTMIEVSPSEIVVQRAGPAAQVW